MSLFAKYDVPAPRYTSYPTVPYWSETPSKDQWIDSLSRGLVQGQWEFAMYLHLPFCESLCTFCGCNTVITKNHSLEGDYIRNLHREWEAYKKLTPIGDGKIRQLHLGGGTPTFFSAENLKVLLKPFVSKNYLEASCEVDPRRTTKDQLLVLRELGFSRVSMGVQDFNPEVQHLINRIQPFDITSQLTRESRELGYESVNFDLIYGLPKQNLKLMTQTIQKTLELRPDRIALYSFALVPWIKPAQRLYKDSDLPQSEEKRELYEKSRELLLGAGYLEIGMDHFALPNDPLAKAQRSGALNRNFMGYTEVNSKVLLGLGVSAISETPDCFHQNEKVLPVYARKVEYGEIPTFRGHRLSFSDQSHRQQILHFMTKYEVVLEPDQVADAKVFLSSMIHDGLVELKQNILTLTEKGRPFLRNACMFFDERLREKSPSARTFSQSI